MTPEEIAAQEAETKRLADEAAAKKLAEEEALKNKDNSLTEEEKIAAKAAELANEQLKDIKGKLDSAFTARDAALKKAEALEKKERDAQLKVLEEAGKHKEVFDLKLVEEQAKYADLESKYNSLLETNLELTRNSNLKEQLRSLDFRSEKAFEMAFNTILPEIIKDDKGNWLHRSGVSIKDFVVAFSKDDSNSFLLKAKTSTGAGTNESNGSQKGSNNSSLVGKSSAEILDMAMKNQLPKS